jgi:hypothetical protein|tara:strand:- start:351 stop:1271 length:921 start_codon:yes stop_codon:yes gene_type:complete
MYHHSVKRALSLLIFFLTFYFANAQEDDLFEELNSLVIDEVIYSPPTFKTLQIANLQSTKMVEEKEFFMVVAHRFGYLKEGVREFYGLDQANTKIQFLYGINKRFQVGVSRDSYEKTYSGTIKIGIKKQSDSFPINLVLYNSMDINTLLNKLSYPGLLFFDRFAYTTQVLISRRFSEKLSMEIAAIYVRQNLIDLNYTKNLILPSASNLDFITEPWNQYLMAVGGRYKFFKRISLNMDYAYNFSKNKNSLYFNPFTIGIDIETGGHVFQLLFTNSRASNDASFLTETIGNWLNGDVSFGFNIVRVF